MLVGTVALRNTRDIILPENIIASLVPVQGPDAVYSMSASLSTYDKGEIEVTHDQLENQKSKKKKPRKKEN